MQIFLRYNTKCTVDKRKKNDKLEFIKKQNFCTSKDTTNGIKSHGLGKNICKSYFLQRIVLKIYKEQINKNTDYPIKNWAKI